MGKVFELKEYAPVEGVTTKINRDDLVFYDANSAPFQTYGIHFSTGRGYYRMDPDIAATVSDNVFNLNWMTAGGRLRFSTDSGFVAVRYRVKEVTRFCHMPLNATSGFDMMIDGEETEVFAGCFHVLFDGDNYSDNILYLPDRKPRYLTINFPLFNDVQELYIGLQKGAKIGAGKAYRGDKPILYYGSSITHGGCASRPSTSYEGTICRHNHYDYINLGYSGSAMGEKNMADYISRQSMAAFVLDYDHNASPELLEETHFNMYDTVRRAQPDLPIIMVTRPIQSPFAQMDTDRRKKTVLDTYRRALDAGDRNVYYVDGESMWQTEDQDICTVDLVHPNDYGFYLMAKVIGTALDRALGRNRQM